MNSDNSKAEARAQQSSVAPAKVRQSSIAAARARQSSVANALLDRNRGTSISSQRPSDARVWLPDASGKYVKRVSQMTEGALPSANENYDPHQHRNVESTIGRFAALMHVLKGILGLAVYRMPYVFQHSGLVVGISGVVFIGSVVSHGMNLLVKTQYKLCKRKRVGYLSYGRSMQYAMEEGPDWMIRFSRQANVAVGVFIVFAQSGTCLAYYWYVCGVVKDLLDEFHCDMFNLRLLMFVCFPALLLITYVPNLKTFTYCSAFANALMYGCYAWILVYMSQQEPSPGPHKLFGKPHSYLFMLRDCLESMEAVLVHGSVERYMRRPKDFVGFFGIMNLGMFVVIVTYVLIGFTGTWVYGKNTPDNLLLILPAGTAISRGVNLLLAVAILANCRLASFPALDTIWDEFFAKMQGRFTKKKQTFHYYILLTGYCVSIMILGMIPTIVVDYYIEIASVVDISLMVVAFPAMMELCYLWPGNYGRYDWIYYKDLGLFVSGLCVFAIGLYVMVVRVVLDPDADQLDNSCATGNLTSS